MQLTSATLRGVTVLALSLTTGAARAQVPAFADATLPGSAFAGVVPGPGGVFFGVTYDGGTNDEGTIFKVTRDLATVTVLHDFNGADGSVPYAELTLGTGPGAGKLFGATAHGGVGGNGTLFAYDLATDTLDTLVTFGSGGPISPLLQIDDYLYGSISINGPGAQVFRVRIDGTGYQTLKAFPAHYDGGWVGADGLAPGALSIGGDGFLYGPATFGGDSTCYAGYGCGTIFRLRPDGSDFSVLKTFSAPAFPNGFPQRRLVVSADGWLYGTTYRGVFRIRPSGADHAVIYALPGGAGSQIFAPPIEGTDGRLYVTQYDGGPSGAGRVFSILKDGTDFQLHYAFSFTSGGYGPYGILYRDSAGTLFGTTEYSDPAPYFGKVFAIRGTNGAPVAIASAPSPVAAGAGCTASVPLNGSGSSDPDSDPLTYVWKEGGATIATGVSPTVSLGVGLHTITLIVTDPAGAFDTMDVVVQVTSSAVVTYAGPALLQQFGANLLSATLTVGGVPAAGIALTFTVNGVAQPPVVTDAAGLAQIAVTLGGSGATAVIQISSAAGGCGGATTTATVPVNRWPSAVATGTSPVTVGPGCTAAVTLDATGTIDLDGDALSYAWSESGLTLATTKTAVVALGAGLHTIDLQVSDGRGGTGSTTVLVSVIGNPTTVLYTGPTTLPSGVPTTVSGRLLTGGTPIAGRSLRFTLGGPIVTGTTDASGVATAVVVPGAPGPATLRTQFLGDTCYQPSLLDTPVTVTPPTATLIVTKLVVNDSGGTKQPGDFTIVVSGSGPVPATFPGSAAGTAVLLNPGAYSVSEITLTGYAGAFGADCAGTIAGGETRTCIVTNDDVGLNLNVSALKAPAAAAPGASFTVTDTTSNIGLGAVPATQTRIWLSSDTAVGGDTLLGARAVPGLAGGTKSSAGTAVTLPAVPPGRYYLLAQADAGSIVAESNEADNTRAKVLIVGPDLLVSALVTTPSAPVSTSPTTIQVTTRNAGGAATSPTLTRLYRSANGKIDPTDTLLATFVVPGLAPGATDAQGVTVTLTAGSYTLIAVCDADNSEAEARETNNIRKRALAVP